MSRENREQIPADHLARIEAALQEAKQAVAGEDLERIRTATDGLTRASHEVAERIYRSASGSGARPEAADSAAGGGKPGDVIDAEYVDAEEKKP